MRAKKLYIPKIFGFKIFGMSGSKYENKAITDNKVGKEKKKIKNKSEK